jgi:hypothetical protein
VQLLIQVAEMSLLKQEFLQNPCLLNVTLVRACCRDLLPEGML